MKYVLVAVLLLGCAAPSAEDREQARQLAWRFYGENLQLYRGTVQTPTIEWLEGAQLDCADGTGFTTAERDAETNEPICWGGDFTPATWTARVAVVPGRTLSGDGVLAHELCHAIAVMAHYYPDGTPSDADPTHRGPCFTANGYAAQADAFLSAQGY